METKTEATIEDLYDAPNDWGTYELVDGRLVHMPPKCAPKAIMAPSQTGRATRSARTTSRRERALCGM